MAPESKIRFGWGWLKNGKRGNSSSTPQLVKVRSIFLVLLCFLFSLGTVHSQSDYTKKEILFLPWGTGENQISLKERKIKIFEKTKIIRTGVQGFHVDENGNIYLRDTEKKKIYRFGFETKKLEKIDFSKTSNNEIDSHSEIFSFAPWKDLGEKTLDIHKGKFEVRYEHLKKYGYSCDQIDVKFGYLTFSKGFAFRDLKNNFYIPQEIRVGYPSYKNNYVVLKLESDNCSYEIVALEGDGPDYPRAGFKVDKFGNIYELLSKEDGVHLIKWEFSN